MRVRYDSALRMVSVSREGEAPLVLTRDEAADLRFSLDTVLRNPGASLVMADSAAREEGGAQPC